jgi:drug/metabolite transporter (DMT)-like permease
MVHFILLFISILLTVFVQIKLKDISIEYAGNILKALFFIDIYIVLFLYAVALVAWFYAASKIEFTVLIPFNALTIVLGGVAGVLIFSESFDTTKFLAYTLIISGVFLLFIHSNINS